MALRGDAADPGAWQYLCDVPRERTRCWQRRQTKCVCVQLIIPTDAAHETIAELGELGLLQFKDLNPDREAFARTYASQVRF